MRLWSVAGIHFGRFHHKVSDKTASRTGLTFNSSPTNWGPPLSPVSGSQFSAHSSASLTLKLSVWLSLCLKMMTLGSVVLMEVWEVFRMSHVLYSPPSRGVSSKGVSGTRRAHRNL
jgi:hypothetical protein